MNCSIPFMPLRYFVWLLLLGTLIVLPRLQQSLEAQEPIVKEFPSPVISLELDPVTHNIYAGSAHRVYVLDSRLNEKKILNTELDYVHAIVAQKDTLLVAGGNPSEHGMIESFSIKGLKPKRRKLVHDDVIHSIKIAGDKLFVGSADSTASALTMDDFTSVRRFNGHSKRVTAVEHLPSDNLIVTGGLDDTLRIWSTRTGELKRVLTHHQDDVLDIKRYAAKPDDESIPRIVTVSRDRTVRFWQPTIGRMIRFKKFDSVPKACCWIPGSEDVLVGFDNGSVKRISSQTLEVSPVVETGEHVFSIKMFDEKSVLVGTRNRLFLKRIQ